MVGNMQYTQKNEEETICNQNWSADILMESLLLYHMGRESVKIYSTQKKYL